MDWSEHYEKDYERTIRENGLTFEAIEGEEKQVISDLMFDTFTFARGGGCEFFWDRYLKYEPEWIDCQGKDPYWHALTTVDPDRVMYFFPGGIRVDSYVYKARMGDIRTFVGDTLAMRSDYYMMTEDGMELYGGTHHDSFFHIDIRTCAPISEDEFHKRLRWNWA